MKRLFFFIAVLAAMLPAAGARAFNIHELNGSDLGMGVGARAIGMGGAFAALGDDASALYWNPAAITEMEHNEAMLMIDADPVRYSYKALVFRPESWKRHPLRMTFGFGRTNRLKYIADGDWTEGNASHLIDLSMIAVERDYVGGLNSRTNDYRFTFASRVPNYENLSVGFTYIDFECVTTFYGQGTGRTCQVVAYETIDLGLHYRDSETRHFGLSLRNPIEATKPKYINAGVALFRGRDVFTFELEHIYGEYSQDYRSVNFIMLRAGMERDLENGWKLRGGLIYPIRARTSTLGNIRAKIPSPKFDVAAGAGYSFSDFTLDFAIYGDPGWGYVKEELRARSVFTLRYGF